MQNSMAQDQDEKDDSTNIPEDDQDESQKSGSVNNEDDSDDSDDEGDTDDPAILKQRLAKAQAHGNRMFERAKVAEGFKKVIDDDGNVSWVKKTKTSPSAPSEQAPVKKPTPQTPSQSTNSPSVDPDELKLIARGLSDEEIEQAKVIAKGTGETILEAIKNPLFTSWQNTQKEIERKEKARLGANKGSDQRTEKDFEPGMMLSKEGKEKHKQLWKKKMGR